jgi:LysM repeat protein
MSHTIEPTTATPAPTVPGVAVVCPYLLAEDGRWRSASPAREHRCTAVAPPSVLAADKQRRLCLVADHVSCATFQVATGHGDLIGAADDHRPPRVSGSAGREIVRTAPLVLDHGRFAIVPAISADRRIGQAALLGLMAIAFAAILVARVSSGTGGPGGTEAAGGVLSGASPTATSAAPEGSAAASAAVPGRTLVPTEVQPSAEPIASGEPSAEPPAEPAPEAATTTYTVRRGDTLSGIAAEFDTTVEVLSDLNDIDDPSRLRVGQVLDLP